MTDQTETTVDEAYRRLPTEGPIAPDLGADTLSGDRGADTLTGGDGADRFLIGADSGADLITDFNGRAGDRIEIVGGVDYQIHGNGRGDALIMVGDTVVTLAGVNPSQLDNWIVG